MLKNRKLCKTYFGRSWAWLPGVLTWRWQIILYVSYVIKGSAKDYIMEYLQGSDVYVSIDSWRYDITSKDNIIFAEIVDNN